MTEVLGVEVHYVAIILAMLVNIVVGMLWYGPLFGKMWMKLMGFKKEELQMKPQDMVMAFVVAFLLAVGLNSVLQFSAYVSELSEVANIFATAGMISATFMAPVMLNQVVWEGRNPKLFLLNLSQFFVTLVGMGFVLNIWL